MYFNAKTDWKMQKLWYNISMKNEKLCSICPRHCNIDRNKVKGFCNETKKIRISKIIPNFQWEEPCITGKKGVLAIFFSGCNLRCDYCQNFEISRGGVGQEYTIDEFVKLIEENQDKNSFVDLITPTHFSNEIALAYEKINKKIPVVWNTNSFETVKNIEKVSKFVDIFLADLKYADDEIAKEFSKCDNYFSVSKKAILKMCEEKPDKFENENNMTQGVIIRHLVLPGYIENSFKVLDTIKENFADRKISLMSQFTPNGHGKLNRKLKPIEYKAVLAHLEKLGLTNGYFQDFESADSCFVPKFV